MSAYFASGRFDVRRQYVLYDYNTFIADVGGYLGLLLGYSALGMVHKLTDTICRVVQETCTKANSHALQSSNKA